MSRGQTSVRRGAPLLGAVSALLLPLAVGAQAPSDGGQQPSGTSGLPVEVTQSPSGDNGAERGNRPDRPAPASGPDASGDRGQRGQAADEGAAERRQGEDEGEQVQAPPLPSESQPSGSRERAAELPERSEEITAEPGKNQIIAVAQGHPNRIVTPYEDPRVRTVHDAEIEVSGSVIYATTAKSSPVTLYITEGRDEDSALSLTLVPKRIPPRTLELAVEGYEPAETAAQRVEPDKAGSWERSHPLRETVTDALRQIARGETPEGYGLKTDLSADEMPVHCTRGKAAEALAFDEGQQLTGRNLRIWVVAARNASVEDIELRGPECYREGVLAVAAWPRNRLEPGDRTELYIVERRPDSDGEETRRRPSLIDGEGS